MKLKTILFTAICGALLTGAVLSGCATNALVALWEADCNSKTRYQTPTDRPYIAREVTIQGGAPDVVLAGELTMPNGPGPFPGVVLISGSGLTDRDSFILGHKPFLVLADYLTRRGYAVYRHDDRGFGKSTGGTDADLDADFSADSAAALKWLRAQDKIDRRRVGYIGHSKGGHKGPLAAQIEKPDFMVFLNSSVESIGGLLLRQSYDITKSFGMSEEELQKQDRDLRKIFAILRASKTLQEAQERVEQYALDQGASKKVAKQNVAAYATPYMMSELKRNDELFAEFDVEITDLIKAYDGPILAVYGEKDMLASAKYNAPRTGPFLRNSKSKVVIISDMNHYFQAVTAEEENREMTEVCDIDMTFSPKALEAIGTWLDEVNSNDTVGRAQ